MNSSLLGIKQRFAIIGNSPELNQAIDVAAQVATTDLSVLIYGESGSGKEVFPKIIHQLSSRKHKEYIAVNCGAIPQGTIDSELFGHEKGSFTGAIENRKGYFEVVDGGTIFLDEVGELPLQTQARLLRVLETGEFLKVGSSKVHKTNVRIVAATNLNISKAIKNGKFREDLYYRLNTIPITIPTLRHRKDDIHMLFKKFAVDMAEKYRMPPLRLEEDAVEILINYRWPGNIRQLKNISEQISILEKERRISGETLKTYLPGYESRNLPSVISEVDAENNGDVVNQEQFKRERELLYKVLFDMKKDINGLKKLVVDIISKGSENASVNEQALVKKMFNDISTEAESHEAILNPNIQYTANARFEVNRQDNFQDTEEVVEENYSLAAKEKEFIIKALEKYKGKRKTAAKELGISERTLYRKINEYDIDL
ncbi:MAG: transcriptional regulator with PAS, ATPase and Fis domain [Saprospiraceae bacterium]|jgi:transcriptional regulator with PAS, ATPase and Fis domain